MLVIVTNPGVQRKSLCDTDYYVTLYGKRDGSTPTVEDTCKISRETLIWDDARITRALLQLYSSQYARHLLSTNCYRL